MTDSPILALTRTMRDSIGEERFNAIRRSLPEPYPLQAEIIASTAKRNIVCAGRRFGKTFLWALIAVLTLLQGKKAFIVSTSQDQADLVWDRIVAWLAPAKGQYYKNETKRLIKLGQGTIKVKTGRDADVLRGFDADVLIMDECAYLHPDAWFSVGSPMLADRNGTAYFGSTPNRKNWFYLLYLKATTDPDWQAWHFPTHANPTLSKEAVEKLAVDMPEDMYRQEILAQFLESGGEVFRFVNERSTLKIRDPYPGRFVAGLDFGQKKDFTVLTVLDVDRRIMVDMLRFRGDSWKMQRDRISAAYERWKPERIYAETNSMGEPNIEALENEGLPMERFTTSLQSKSPMIESLALAFEREGEIAVLDDAILTAELSAFERKVSPTTGRSQYSAPDGMHDDCVMSLALAYHGLQRFYGRVIDFVDNGPVKPKPADEAFNSVEQFEAMMKLAEQVYMQRFVDADENPRTFSENY